MRVVSGLNELRVNPLHRPRLADEVSTSMSALALDAHRGRALVTQLKEYTRMAEAMYPPGA